MSRSGYTDDCDNLNIYRATVKRAIRGKRGQAFLHELAKTLDEMPDKKLITSELISEDGSVCAIGSICKARGLDISEVDVYEADQVGALVNISKSLAAEIEYENDEGAYRSDETPGQRWIRMRKWVQDQLTVAP